MIKYILVKPSFFYIDDEKTIAAFLPAIRFVA